MAETLEYDISAEVRGVMTPGRLKLSEQNIVYKNSKTGKVDTIPADDIDLINSQKFVGNWGIRVFTKSGNLYRFVGFKDSENEKLAKFVKKVYHQDMVEKEMCVKGWNWGTANFKGSVLSFDKDSKMIFEIPLSHVSQCTTGKNEVTIEFHQNDDAPVGLMEMRFHIPAVESAEEDPVETFQTNVMSKASVISASGDAIAIFREIHCLTPRGRYDIKVFSTFFQLHGKTFDYKIPMDSVLRLFLLPHKDNRQMFFVLSLDPPIKQGQTRYHYLVLLFSPEDETSIELPFTEEELKEKYEGKLEKEISGPLYEVMGKVMKVLIGRKITGPGNFVGHSGTAAVGCSFKAAAGYLYPLERGFIYIHKPPVHIRFEEIATVNFARSGGSTRSFDFEVTLKNGTVHTFSSIEKEEYSKLFDFINQKKLNISNVGKDKGGYKDVDFGDSDNENEPDAYLARVKAEAREKDSDDDEDGSEEESTDEDFKPNENESDVAEEYDSNVASDSEDSDASGGGGGGGSGDEGGAEKKEKKKPKKEKKEKKEKPEKKEKTKKASKKKDANKPKRATTAFMLWLNDTREQIKNDNPGIKVTEIAKKAGELWKELKDKSKWEELAAKDKQRYIDEMKDYKPAADDSDDEGGAAKGKATKKRKKENASPKKSANTSGSFKSKEYISDDDSSSDEGDKKKSDSEPENKKSKKADKDKGDKDKKSKDSKKKAESEEDEEEEEASASEEEEEESEEEGDESD
ncbi:FACT complex subunit Ssrp1-like [Musca vetustissima]|uniref:FACT complex subunit Ssrp1-like n=1 Tax=Musca vetustissima TaxID=27455 RepID=UPI002AB6FF58|nr:FACT complex subunit Ssrp1-like [Musca vetustissima]